VRYGPSDSDVNHIGVGLLYWLLVVNARAVARDGELRDAIDLAAALRGGVGCRLAAAIHPGRVHTRVVRRASAGVGCVVFGTCGRQTVVSIGLVGREGHGLAGPQQVRRTLCDMRIT